MNYFFIFLCVWLSIEFFLWVILRWLRASFQWLIMGSDESPLLNVDALEKFAKKGMDSELGWIRKPYTTGKEKGRAGKSTRFTVNKYGARSNPGFDDKQSYISLFGDSYAFGRQVNDNQTWAHHVSKQIHQNILNFGVGNYGLDQALLRLKRESEIRNPELCIILVVPETICRIQSVWKHYSEYGNTFAFKPRFILKNEVLTYIKNPINTKEKYHNYKKYLKEIRKNDYFYKGKFSKDILTFPYVISLTKSCKRNLPLIFSLIHAKISRNNDIKDKPFKKVLNNNHLISKKCYQDEYSLNLMSALINESEKLCKEKNSKFLFCLVPQLQDIQLIKQSGPYYKNFFNGLSESVNILDLTDVICEQDDFHKCYTHDVYGGHLSKYGNQLISKVISNKIKYIMNN